MATMFDVEVPAVPRLESGDHLSAEEFMRRYGAMPDAKRAELIEGVVIMPSPVSTFHSMPHAALMHVLTCYRALTPVVEVHGNCTIKLDDGNVVEPDGLLRVPTEKGGRTRVIGGYIWGGPELVAEIAATSASIDLHAKRDVYERHGVEEYLVWRALESSFDWFAMTDGKLVERPIPTDGVIRSVRFPGLWLDTAALLRLDLVKAQASVNAGCQTPEHAAFLTS